MISRLKHQAEHWRNRKRNTLLFVATPLTTRDLVEELFWDDIDKLKPMDFKTEVLFDLIASLYRQKYGLKLPLS
jgi:hypothetical protein